MTTTVKKNQIRFNGKMVSIGIDIHKLFWRITALFEADTGLRPGIRLLNYYGEQGALRISKDKGDENCFYCKGVRGLKDKADMERYIRDGVSQWLRAA